MHCLQKKKSSHDGYLYCLNCFNSYTTENMLKEHEEIYNDHDSYPIEMPKQAEKKIKIHSWRKIIKGSIYNLS